MAAACTSPGWDAAATPSPTLADDERRARTMAVTWMHNPEDGQDYPADTPVERARLRALGYIAPASEQPAPVEEPQKATPPPRLSRTRHNPEVGGDPVDQPPAGGVNAPDGSA